MKVELLARHVALSAVLALTMLPGGGAVAQTPATPATSNAALYSPDADPFFAQPYVDIDEWRDAPVRHRYVHGGFKGTETRFSFYFPPKAQYGGRFFQYITPVPDNENIAQGQGDFAGENPIGFAVDSGAYFVETNGGGKFDLGKIATAKYDPTISAYRANAASAAYSRVVALKMYGGKRPYGYAYGGSGGGYRTIGGLENTTGVWDGAVPFVIGSTMAIPNMFTVRMRAMRILGDKLDGVVDAASPGGSGDIYAGLTPLEAEALREVTRMGFEPQSWFGWRTMGIHGFAALYQGVVGADPGYFSDFWTKPGYLGHDHPEQFIEDRLQFDSSVAGVLTAAEAARQRINLDASRESERGGVDTAFRIPEGAEGQRIAAFRLAAAPPKVDFLGGDLIVESGAAKGKKLPLARIVGDIAVLGIADASIAAQLKPGDAVRVDNSNFLAVETYHRHQVPGPEFATWDQFRKADGTPIYPQRSRLIGPGFVQATAGSLQTGRFQGKMIVVESLWDREALPWQADWYRARVAEHLGPAIDANFRVWFTDHALHGGVEDATRTVSYIPLLQQALRDVAAWAERGVAPSPSTSYRIDDGQVIVAPTAAARRGIQPVVTLKVAGRDSVTVRVGAKVSFTGTIAVPPGTGGVVAAEWDFDGTGAFPVSSRVATGAKRVTVKVTHRFDRPGTWFPALRGVSQRIGDPATPYARIANLGRVRVVVE